MFLENVHLQIKGALPSCSSALSWAEMEQKLNIWGKA